MRPRSSPRWLWLSLGVVALDRATKLLIETRTAETFRYTLIPGFITLVHSRNSGIAFGLLADSGSPWISRALIAAAAAVTLLLGWVLATSRAGAPLAQAGVALVLGGAVGNLVDRLLHGGVTDFFEVGIGSYHWPAFNLADSAITIGAVLLVYELLFARRHTVEEKK